MQSLPIALKALPARAKTNKKARFTGWLRWVLPEWTGLQSDPAASYTCLLAIIILDQFPVENKENHTRPCINVLCCCAMLCYVCGVCIDSSHCAQWKEKSYFFLWVIIIVDHKQPHVLSSLHNKSAKPGKRHHSESHRQRNRLPIHWKEKKLTCLHMPHPSSSSTDSCEIGEGTDF